MGTDLRRAPERGTHARLGRGWPRSRTDRAGRAQILPGGLRRVAGHAPEQSAARMTERSQAPAMSVVLATPGDFTTIAATVRHLRRQSIAERLELVVVARTADALSAEESAFHGFWGHQ